MQWLVKVGSSPLEEVIVASLLYHKGRTARWFTTQWASGTMCVALAPTRGQTPANLVAGFARPPLEEGAATRSDSRGLCGEASFGRYILISSDLLKRLNETLTMTDPRTSYFGGIITHWQVSKC